MSLNFSARALSALYIWNQEKGNWLYFHLNNSLMTWYYNYNWCCFKICLPDSFLKQKKILKCDQSFLKSALISMNEVKLKFLILNNLKRNGIESFSLIISFHSFKKTEEFIYSFLLTLQQKFKCCLSTMIYCFPVAILWNFSLFIIII